MLVKAIPILHRYLSRLKIIDIHILQQQVGLHILSVLTYIYVCMFIGWSHLKMHGTIGLTDYYRSQTNGLSDYRANRLRLGLGLRLGARIHDAVLA